MSGREAAREFVGRAVNQLHKSVAVHGGDVGLHLGHTGVFLADVFGGEERFEDGPIVGAGEGDDALRLGDDLLPAVDAGLGHAETLRDLRLACLPADVLHVRPPLFHGRIVCAWLASLQFGEATVTAVVRRFPG